MSDDKDVLKVLLVQSEDASNCVSLVEGGAVNSLMSIAATTADTETRDSVFGALANLAAAVPGPMWRKVEVAQLTALFEATSKSDVCRSRLKTMILAVASNLEDAADIDVLGSVTLRILAQMHRDTQFVDYVQVLHALAATPKLAAVIIHSQGVQILSQLMIPENSSSYNAIIELLGRLVATTPATSRKICSFAVSRHCASFLVSHLSNIETETSTRIASLRLLQSLFEASEFDVSVSRVLLCAGIVNALAMEVLGVETCVKGDRDEESATFLALTLQILRLVRHREYTIRQLAAPECMLGLIQILSDAKTTTKEGKLSAAVLLLEICKGERGIGALLAAMKLPGADKNQFKVVLEGINISGKAPKLRHETIESLERLSKREDIGRELSGVLEVSAGAISSKAILVPDETSPLLPPQSGDTEAEATLSKRRSTALTVPVLLVKPVNPSVEQELELVVENLILTERDYVARLTLAVDHFSAKLPLIKGKGDLDSQRKRLFSTLPRILPGHKTFLEQLVKYHTDWPKHERPLGALLFAVARNTASFYLEYISTVEKSFRLHMENMRDSNYNSFERHEVHQPNGSRVLLTISDSLLVPVLRILAYGTTLRRYIALLNDGHEDFYTARAALEEVAPILAIANTANARLMRLVRLSDLQDRLIGFIVKPDWTLAMSSEVVVSQPPPDWKTTSTSIIFMHLLSECLLICTAKPAKAKAKTKQKHRLLSGLQFTVCREITLSCVTFLPATSSTVDQGHVASEEEMQRSFGLIYRYKAKDETLWCICASKEERDEWMRAFKETLHASKLRKYTARVLQSEYSTPI